MKNGKKVSNFLSKKLNNNLGITELISLFLLFSDYFFNFLLSPHKENIIAH